jgi:predicted dinucleotide-binding enzyme
MRIGVIGSGHIGATIARRLVDEGHEVAISNSRGPETLGEVAEQTGAQPATVEGAAAFGDVVVEAIPFFAYDTLPEQALEGKVLVDASNYYPARDGTIDAVESGTPSAQVIADHLPGTRVVKAFNTVFWERIRDEHKPSGDPDRLGVPVAGDDEDAKRLVFGLVDQIGFDAVDAGSLADSRRQEPGAPVYGNVTNAEGVRDALGSTA